MAWKGTGYCKYRGLWIIWLGNATNEIGLRTVRFDLDGLEKPQTLQIKWFAHNTAES